MTRTYFEIYLDDIFFWQTESEEEADRLFDAIVHTHEDVKVSLYRDSYRFFVEWVENDFDNEPERELAENVKELSFTLLREIQL